MADTSSLSSPDGFDSFAEAVNKDLNNPTDTSGFDQFGEALNAEEFAKTSAAARWAKQYDPGAYSEAAKLFPEDPEVGIRQLSDLKDMEKLRKYQEVFQASPSIRSYFAENPKSLPLANPDELDNISGISWIGSAGKEAFISGYDSYLAAMAQNRIDTGKAEPNDHELVNNYLKSANRTYGADGWFDQGWVYLAQNAAPMGIGFLKGAEGALQGGTIGAIGGATVGATGGSVLPGLGTAVGAGAGAAAGAVVGAQAGAIAGAFRFQQNYQIGLNSISMAQIKDEDGNTIDPTVRRFASIISGSASAALESASLGAFISQVPGVKQLLTQFTGSSMENLLKNGAFRQTLYNAGKAFAIPFATEVTTEMLQQGVQIAAEEIAKQASEGNFDARSIGEAGSEILGAGIQAAQVMSVLGPLAAVGRISTDVYHIQRSKRILDNLDKVISHVENNELVKRSPETASELIDKQSQNQQLYIPAKEMQELFQSQDMDIYGPAIPNWRNRIQEALAVDGDVKVSLGEYISYINTDPRLKPLAALVRADPQGYTRAEIAPYEAALKDLISSEFNRAQETAQNNEMKISATPQIDVFPELEQLKEQIKSIGFSDQAVDAYSSMLGAFFNTMANRTGKTASEFYNDFMLSVQRGPLRNPTEGTSPLNEFFQTEQQTSPIETLNQENKGSIRFGEDKATVTLFQTADMSTLLHESGHFFLETMKRVKDTSPELKADWDKVAKYLKLEGDKISREQHEMFAKASEAYFMRGKAPSPELATAFQAFKNWLKAIYTKISNLGVRVTPEIRDVFDRMFTTEQRIEELQNDAAFAPLFKSAEEMGVPIEEYLAYQDAVEKERKIAEDKVRERIVGQTARLSTGWMKEIENELAKEAETKLSKMPPYSHTQLFKDKKISIDPEDFKKQYSETAMKTFPREAFKAKKGLPIGVVSEVLGYASPDEMVHDFVEAKPIKQAAREIAQTEMVNRYGENFEDSDVFNLAVQEAMADDARLTALGTEYKALNKKLNKNSSDKDNTPIQVAKSLAKRTVYSKRILDLDPRAIQSTVRRNGAKAEQAVVNGDFTKAADFKRRQLLAQAIANETSEVSRTVVAMRNKLARLLRAKTSGVAPEYLEQIYQLVNNYELAKVSKKQLNARQTLRQLIDSATENGEVIPPVPDRILRDLGKVNWQELSVEDFYGLYDTISNLEHIGRDINKVRVGQAKMEFNEAKEEIISGINSSIARRGTKQKVSNNYVEKSGKLATWASNMAAALLKPEQIVEWLDAGNIKGPVMKYIFQPIADAQGVQNKLLLEYTSKLDAIMKKISGAYLSEHIHIPEIGKNLTREEMYVMVLNAGSESNYAKLMQGELLSEDQFQGILNKLSKEDMDNIQKMWDVLDPLWEKIASLEKRLTGIVPPKTEARQLNTPHGIYRGGYYPVIYDFDSRRGKNLLEDTTPADKVLSSQMFNNQFTMPGTSHKFTTKRTAVAKPIKLDLTRLPAHIHTVIHDLAYREAVKNARKFLWDPDVKQAIIAAEGKATYEQMQFWLRAVATERATQNDFMETALRRIRIGTTMFGMGFRLTTALAQPLGFFNSLVRVGPAALMSGIYQMTLHPSVSLDYVNGISTEMRDRMNMQDRDIADTVNRLKNTKLDSVRKAAFVFIGAMDKYVATATWLGAYQKYMRKSPNEAEAIMHADRTVRLTQGTGNIKDMAQVMNSSETMKLFTMFYSFFSAQWNAQVDLTRKTGNDIKTGNFGDVIMKRLPQWAYLVAFPAVFGALISGNGPEDDESWLWWMSRKIMMYPFAAVPVVRDIAGALDSGFGYQFSPAAKAFDKTAQALGDILTTEDKGIDERFASALKPAVTAASIAFKIPAGQAMNSVEALWKGLENDDLQASDIIYGRRGR